jgi:predicted SAM-dependent methyltransferase
VTTVHADLCQYNFPKNHFDIIVTDTVLGHLTESCLTAVTSALTAALKPGGVLYASVFTVEDPGYQIQLKSADATPTEPPSEFAATLDHYFALGELRERFSSMEVLSYYEGIEEDRSHGLPHVHGYASIFTRSEYRPKRGE